MIKELWILAKMLFRSKPAEKEKVSLLGMKHIPFVGYKYLMWCGYMIYRDDMYDRRQKEWPTDIFKVDMNHEQIHLMQAKMCGSWIKYYWRYLCEWIKGGPLLNPASAAYYTIPFEAEAYANEHNFDYSINYNGANLVKYTFKERKKLYKELGGEPNAWKYFVKNL